MVSTWCISLTSVEEIQFLLQAITASFIKYIRNYSYYNIMATVEELEEQIFNTITSLRNNKKQPNKGTICCITSKFKTTKSLKKVALQGTLNKLAHCKKLKEKQHSEKKS